MEMALPSGDDGSWFPHDSDDWYPCPLHEAIVHGDLDKVTELLNGNVVRINQMEGPVTPLCMVIQCAGGRNDLDHFYTIKQFQEREVYKTIVYTLLEYGADPNYCRADMATPLQEAMENEDYSIADMLLCYGADVNKRSSSRWAQSPIPLLCGAIRKGNLEQTKWFLDHGADVNATDGDWCKSALHDAVYCNSTEVIDAVLSANADINQKDNFGLTPIAYFRSASVLEMLLMKGASMNIRNSDDQTMVEVIGRKLITKDWFEEGVKMLEKHSAHIQESLGEIIFGGCRVASEQCWPLIQSNIKLLIEKYPMDQANMDKVLFCEPTAFHLRGRSVLSGNCVPVSVLQLFWDIGVDINTQNEYGETLLHIACKEKEHITVAALIDAGIDTELRDNSGATAQHIATKHSLCMASFIMNKNIARRTSNVQDEFGSTPLHWAVLAGFSNTIAGLVDPLGGDVNIRDSCRRRPCELPLASHWTLQQLCSQPDPDGNDCAACDLGARSSILGSCFGLDPGETCCVDEDLWRGHVPMHLQDIQRFAEMVLNSHCMGLLLDIPDNKDIVDSIMHILVSVAEEIGREDPRLTSAVELTGSNREGTKVIVTDEIDVMFTLEVFKNRFRPLDVELAELHGSHCKLQHIDKHDGTLLDFLLDDDEGRQILSATAVIKAFYAAFDTFILTAVKANSRSPSLCLETMVQLSQAKVGSCTFLWRSAHYKDLEISVDVVLAVEVTDWKPIGVVESSTIHHSLPSSFFVVLKPAAQARAGHGKWETVLRVSASNLDVTIIENIPEDIMKGFILMKALNQSPFLPRSAQIPSYLLKNAMYHCLQQELDGINSTLWECDKAALVSAAVDRTGIASPPLAWAKAFCMEIAEPYQVESPIFSSGPGVLQTDIACFHDSCEMLSVLLDMIKCT